MSAKVNKTGKRRGSEIYFVLYLAALILLLPGKQDKKPSEAINAITALFQQSFSLLPEKNSLLSKITTDATGASILQLDTSNVLLLTGNIRDVTFECIVEDQQNDEVIQVASKDGEHFSIVYDSTKKLVFFSWHPPVSMLASLNKSISYVVTVRAKAKPFISNKNPELQQLLRGADATLQTEARFSISILTEGIGEAPPKIVYMPAETTFTRMMYQPAMNAESTSTSIVEGNGLNGGIPFIEQEFTMQPMNSKLDVVAYQQWTNKIFVQGIYRTTDYEGKPFVTFTNRNNDIMGNAEVIDIRGGELTIRGIAPERSAMIVKVTAKRKADKKTVSTEFIVNPKSLNEPEIPKFMHPDYMYTFKPEMPISNDFEARAILRNSQRILQENARGLPFTYTPDIEDTGTVVFFERWINGKIAGKSYSIRVEPFPNPEIPAKSKLGKTFIVEVRSFGRYKGRPNMSRIEFVRGSAVNVWPAQDNRADYDARNGYYTIQKFVIKPKDESKPFSVIIIARDKFGKISDEMFIQSE